MGRTCAHSVLLCSGFCRSRGEGGDGRSDKEYQPVIGFLGLAVWRLVQAAVRGFKAEFSRYPRMGWVSRGNAIVALPPTVD